MMFPLKRHPFRIRHWARTQGLPARLEISNAEVPDVLEEQQRYGAGYPFF